MLPPRVIIKIHLVYAVQVSRVPPNKITMNPCQKHSRWILDCPLAAPQKFQLLQMRSLPLLWQRRRQLRLEEAPPQPRLSARRPPIRPRRSRHIDPHATVRHGAQAKPLAPPRPDRKIEDRRIAGARRARCAR